MAFVHAKGVKAKLGVLFGPPDNIDPRYRLVLERRLSNVRAHREPSFALRQYITAQTAGSLLLLFFMLLFEHYLTLPQLVLLALFLLLSLVNSGAMLDQRRWIFYLEVARIMVLAVLVGLQFRNAWALSGIIVLGTLLLYFFRPAQKRYLAFLYR